MSHGFAHFGREAKSYAHGRRGYPETVFYYLKVFVREEEPILDLGCGTGIATRQLVLNGFQDVQGADIDSAMIDEARSVKSFKSIPYWVAPAEHLPFRSHFFQAVTCFSSFHWFAHSEALTEIKRVLKPNGVLFLVNKEDLSPFKEEIKQKIEATRGFSFPSIPTFDELTTLLKKERFTLEEPKAFEADDLYFLPEAIDYIKSTSYWSDLGEDEKIFFLDTVVTPLLKGHLTSVKQEQDRIRRHYQAHCLVAHKS